MLGGSKEPKQLKDNGVPGPDSYNIKPNDSIPGFVIMQETSKVRKEEDLNKETVGPQRYDPFHPAQHKSSFNKVRTIGNSNRPDLI